MAGPALPQLNVSALAVATTVTGIVFIWSGIKGVSVLAAVQDVIQGKKPRAAQAHPITPPAAGTNNPSNAGGGSGPSGSAPRISPPPSTGGGGGGGRGGGGGGGLGLPKVGPPKVAPPPVRPIPPSRMRPAPSPKRPWWDPRGWF